MLCIYIQHSTRQQLHTMLTICAVWTAVRSKGGAYLEAPVSGSKKPAEDGALIFLCAGDRSLYEQSMKALEVMGKKAFVLTFDDVDTNFRHGHVILETIRKYLTSKQLIILLSGDLDLYGRLIRKNIYSTFGGDILQHDSQVTKAGNQGI